MRFESSRSAQLAVLLTAVIWSTGGLAVKLSDCSPTALTGIRSIFCILLFLVVYRRENLLIFSRAQWAGAVAYCSMAYCYSASTMWTTAANAILLQYTAPVFVAIFSWWLLREKVSSRDWLAIGCVMVGIFLFFMDKASPGHMLGNAVAVLSGLSYALFIVFSRKQKDANPAGSIFLGNLIALVVSLPELVTTNLTTSAIVGGMYLGLVYGGLAFILYAGAIKSVNALTAILIATIEPILNPIWVFLTIGETPSLMAVVGGIIVVGTLLVRNIAEVKMQQ